MKIEIDFKRDSLKKYGIGFLVAFCLGKIGADVIAILAVIGVFGVLVFTFLSGHDK